MKITVLMENTASGDTLAAEHGLSLYIEAAGWRILFDMGQTDAFARNAGVLGIDLKGVDIAVLSHGHYDHGGGLARFLEINPHAPVYLSRRAFGEYYHGPDKYIGLSKSLKMSARLRPVDEDFVIDDSLSLHAKNAAPLTRPIESFGLSEIHEGAHVPDRFAHEQYLLIRENGRQAVISGCAHKGVVNIARWFAPDVLIGGFHLAKLHPDVPGQRQQLDEIAAELSRGQTRYFTGHCTGAAAYGYLKQQLGDRLQPLTTGMTFEI